MKKIVSKLVLLASVLTVTSCGGNNSGDKANRNLLAHFDFKENAEGLLIDETNHVKDTVVNYVLKNSPSHPVTNVSFKKGINNEAMVFDGYSTYASIDSSELMPSGKHFTISSWIAPRAYNWSDKNEQNDNIQAIASQYYKDDSFSMGFTFGYKRDGQFMFGCGTTDGWKQLYNGNNPLKQYEWNNICAVFDGEVGEIKLFLNGLIVNRMSIIPGTEIVQCDLPLLIGKNSVASSDGDCSTNMISGLLDDLRFYKSSLPYKEYKEYYKSCLDENGNIPECNFDDVWLQNSLKNDYYRPQYHGAPFEHWTNEPHAPIYYNGVYHLFHQQNPNGPYFNGARGIQWGHLTSPDMVNWTPRKEAVSFRKGTVAPDGVWSGGSSYDKDGVPILFITAGDYEHAGMISNQNIGIARPKDPSDPYLTEWVVDERLAVVQQQGQGDANEFRDPQVLKFGDDYIMIICSGDEKSGRGTALIYTTNVNKRDYLHNWEYKGHVFDYNNPEVRFGRAWELPFLLPLKNEAGEDSGNWIFGICPAPATTADNNTLYWIGNYNKETFRFTPLKGFEDPRRMDLGDHACIGPATFVDPQSGDATMFNILTSKTESLSMASSGWANNFSIGRKMYFDTKTNDLGLNFVNTSGIEDKVLFELSGEKTVDFVNTAIKSINEDMVRIDLTAKVPSGTLTLSVNVSENKEEATEITYDSQNNKGYVNTMLNKVYSSTASGNFVTDINNVVNDEISVTVLLDKSQVEVLFNNYKTITARSYSSDVDHSFMALKGGEGVTITSFKVTKMKSIF